MIYVYCIAVKHERHVTSVLKLSDLKAIPGRFVAFLRGLSLSQQFLIASSLLIGASMLIVGWWVSLCIEQDVIRNTARATGLYMESELQPMLQELEQGKKVSAPTRVRLDNLVTNTPIGRQLATVKIWMPGGLVTYSNRPEVDGKYFPVTQHQVDAWNGVPAAEFEDLVDDENAEERKDGIPLLEIYAPIRSASTGKVIAVGEFYQRAKALRNDLDSAIWHSWLIVALIAFILIGALFSIVRRGNLTIDQQRSALEGRISELSRLMELNQELHRRVDQAHARSVETNERFLRRIGAELHDGPAQLIGLALLKLDQIKPRLQLAPVASNGVKKDDVAQIGDALRDALREVRNVAAGLALPEIERVPLAEAIRMAARLHEQRTGTKVSSDIGTLPCEVDGPLKTCLYRFTQEGLNNAFRHADGKGQLVRMRGDSEHIEIEVADDGPGISASADRVSCKSLGLVGLRNRVESLGGRFEIESEQGKGTLLRAGFNVRELRAGHA